MVARHALGAGIRAPRLVSQAFNVASAVREVSITQGCLLIKPIVHSSHNIRIKKKAKRSWPAHRLFVFLTLLRCFFNRLGEFGITAFKNALSSSGQCL